ncbi:hypothetical protein FisN_12Lh141 [Fistulifera solaris]|uniref:Uncharacterized protein n=1 Tax=Fistulifera solaris TaxID=1519565 RepID=A0A1Z5JMZ1_FISSO|nr:hypothetical protein FisN_12Lh141 [Fistulifera solaris]|eukprot:GAX15158.1 hypothetical protein FisN_12Lh141 [Fistulifera solaris]
MQRLLLSVYLPFTILTGKCGVFAFLTISSVQPFRLLSTARSFSTPSNVNDDNNNHFDAEEVRKRLESLLTISAHPFRDEEDFPSNGWHSVLPFLDALPSSTDRIHAPPSRVDIELPPAPLLTTLERERRSMEIALLKNLAQGDDSVADLTNLWCRERGTKAAARLYKVEQMMAESRWEDAERELRKIIQHYGFYWVEPIHRLATLMILQKRWLEAEKMLLIVLAVKPWHVGALSGIVMTYAALQDNQRATEWAARRLPKWGGHRRASWSSAAVQLAQDALFDAEEQLKDMFGARDTHHSILRWRGVFVPNDGITFWQ